MNKTQIEWVKNPDGTQGYTWNPITGCLNHTPEGLCLGGMFPCYAYKLANGRLKERYLANMNFVRPEGKDFFLPQNDPFYPRLWGNRFGIIPFSPPSKPIGIFVCDMGELFGAWIPEAWQESVFTSIRAHWNYRFYLLTKQPQNLIKFSPFPDNCWVGVTVTDRYSAHNAHFYLPNIGAKVKYISFEPLLDDAMQALYCWNLIRGANWVIIGAQTKPYKPPKIEWVEKIVRACDKAGIPVFLKDNLLPLFIERFPPKPFENFGCWNLPDWAIDKEPKSKGLLKLRQEMPR